MPDSNDPSPALSANGSGDGCQIDNVKMGSNIVSVAATPADASIPIKASPSISKTERDAGLTVTTDASNPFNLPTAPTFAEEVVIIGLVLLAQLMARAGLSQSIAPIVYIGGTFGTTTTADTLWFPAAFSLTAGTCILVAGRVGDIFGHKLIFLLGVAWYALWSLLAGVAALPHSPSVVFFDVSRAMQGVAVAVLTPTGLAILGSIYKPGPRKAKVFSIFAAAAPNGFVLGALFSAIFAEEAWWPWAYWCLAILCIPLGAASYFYLPDLRKVQKAQPMTLSPGSEKKFDWWGSVTGVAGLTFFNVAWNQAPAAGWTEPYVIVLLALGVILIAAFVLIERVQEQPLVPIKFMPASALVVLGCVALGWASFGIWVYYFWQFLVVLRGASPLNATAQILPGSATGLCAAIMSGFLLSRVQKSYILAAALLAFCTGNIVAATMPVHQLYWLQAFWSVLIIPFGMDLSFPAATLLMSDVVPRSHQGVAASTVAAVINYSVSIGLGIAGTVEANVSHGDVLRGFRGGWYMGVGLSGVGVLLAIAHALVDACKQRRQKRNVSDMPDCSQASKQPKL